MVSLAIQEWSDAGFIGAELLVNAMIGTFQEYSAQRAAEALHRLVTTNSRVLREGDAYEIDAEVHSAVNTEHERAHTPGGVRHGVSVSPASVVHLHV